MRAPISTRLAAALAAIALSLTLVSCAGTTGAAATAPAQGSNADPTQGTNADPTESESPDASATPTDDGTIAFGQAYKYDDGLQIIISAPKPYKPSRWAAFKKSKGYLVMTVTVLNGTSAKFEPAMFSMTAQSGDEEGDQVFDSGNGLKGAPSTKLLKGRQAKWKVAFGVKNPKDLVLEVTPDFEHDSVIFQLG